MNLDSISAPGACVLPDEAGNQAHRHLIVSGCKGKNIYVIDRDDLGGLNPATTASRAGAPQGRAPGSGPVYEPYLLLPEGRREPARLSHRQCADGRRLLLELHGRLPGSRHDACPSANGANNGIAWVIRWTGNSTRALLHAFDANDLSKELYNSDQAGTDDQISMGIGFSVPTVANGKVFVGTIAR